MASLMRLLAGLKGNREIYSGVHRVVAGEDEAFGGMQFLAFAAIGIYGNDAQGRIVAFRLTFA